MFHRMLSSGGCWLLAIVAGIVFLSGIGVAWFWMASPDSFRTDPQLGSSRSKQLVGRWDSPPDAPRNAQFSWMFTDAGRYEFKQDFRRPPGALTWYIIEDKGTWKLMSVKGNRVKVKLDPGTFAGEVEFELPDDPAITPQQIYWRKYSDIDYQLRLYPLQATAIDDESWKE